MSATYQPDAQAVPQLPWNITLLSQRDASIQIPIPYLTLPAIAVTPACFSHRTYSSGAAAQCLSNLLATGFTRLVVDLYWDQRRLAWTFCPAEIPIPLAADQATALVNVPSTAPQQLSGAAPTRGSNSAAARKLRRNAQQGSSAANPDLSGATPMLTTISINPTSTFTDTVYNIPPTATASPPGGETLYSVGPYKCSPLVDLSLLTSLLSDYLPKTDNTLQASIQYLTFRIHAANHLNSTFIPATSRIPPDRLPSTPNLLGNIFNANLSSYLFTPNILASQRANLNSSWLTAANASRPDPAYYTSHILPNGSLATPDGWPSISYMEFQNQRRLLLEVAEIDDQMSGYESENDDYIFARDVISSFPRDLQVSANGTIRQGCIFDPNNPTLSAANNSWAIAQDTSQDINSLTSSQSNNDNDITPTLPSITNLTSCGYSPLLNATLPNTPTADQDITPYQRLAYASVWSWAPGEPRPNANSTSPLTSTNTTTADSNPGDDSPFRCALFNATGPSPGRWETARCGTPHRGACRTDLQPLLWRLTPSPGAYSEVAAACPAGTSFAVPRTALENAYLLRALLSSDAGAGVRSLWIDLNALSTQDCWVSGPNATCPYRARPSHSDGAVVVPTVAGLVIIILALATVLIKCGSNRRERRGFKGRRRRLKEGWEYEGVPN